MHLPTGEHRGTNNLAHRKKASYFRGTHQLKNIEGGANQHANREQVIKVHLPTGECKRRYESAHRKEASY